MQRRKNRIMGGVAGVDSQSSDAPRRGLRKLSECLFFFDASDTIAARPLGGPKLLSPGWRLADCTVHSALAEEYSREGKEKTPKERPPVAYGRSVADQRDHSGAPRDSSRGS